MKPAQLDSLIQQFERCWPNQGRETFDSILEHCPSEHRGWLRLELLTIDMELNWKSYRGQPTGTIGWAVKPTWKFYCSEFPEIGPLEALPAERLAEEYRVRRIWGDRPSIADMRKDYPFLRSADLLYFQRVDHEIKQESVREVSLRDADAECLPERGWEEFLLHQYVGGGGFGKVYRATDRTRNQTVAVKALRKRWQKEIAVITLLRQEAEILSRLPHPGIARCLGIGKFPGGGHFLVLEYIAGENLANFLQQKSPSLKQIRDILRDVAEALQFAHDQGVIHGDVKPANILLNREGRAILTDFGLARTIDSRNANRYWAGGTAGFLAPEVEKTGQISIASDLYSLGAVLSQLLAAEDAQAVGTPISSPSKLAETLSHIRNRCLSPQPGDRYCSAREILEELQAQKGIVQAPS